MVESLDPVVREVDAFAVHMEEDPLLRSTIVAVALFDTTPDWDVFVDRMERATRLAPSFRSLLVQPPLRLGPLRRIPDPDFDLSWHLRRMAAPAPHTLDEVLSFASTSGMTAFDVARPLWEFTLVEDLTDGRAALVMKVHHSLTDGIGGIQLAQHVVDLQREAPELGPMPEVPPAEPTSTARLVVDSFSSNLTRTAALAGDRLRRLPGDLVGLIRDPIGVAGRGLEVAGSIINFARPVTRTMSPLMTDRRLAWRYHALDVPFAELRLAGKSADGTVNDAFMAAVAGGLARYHDRHGLPVEELRVTMPVSVRASDDAEGGNRITLARIVIPVGLADPAERIRAIRSISRQWRSEPSIPYTNAIAGALNLLPRTITGDMLKHVDFTASNVPGFSDAIYVGGARVTAFYPFGPPIGASANFTLMSYAGTCNIGLTADRGAITNPEELMSCLVEGFDEVLGLGGGQDDSVRRPT
ncbi:MAG: wax ester/triacylglycerol synthase domain-containing protein [Candidatus Microthrix subdominans]|jgi:diacylglycerol O-acyltransferase|uniref:wax ester/triacylglycerol synthase domain-containing protein n=1 Tax=Candidatus Neomicrothrix sp. TaxID=2719034 RepID=UPI002592E908|nr:wax ester/triacylglycerol synthase domain-containing protein [Candidatus Microthrix sp.]HMS47045.1 wax ester/triacylglycerol synthase family O-acyltransferase [Candidatus Microthrix sp.]